jgi:hypothetical protein
MTLSNGRIWGSQTPSEREINYKQLKYTMGN